MTILPRLPAHMRILTKAEHERLCVVMEPHVATRERVHDALTYSPAVVGLHLPPPNAWPDMCTALHLVHSDEFADTGYLGAWIQCELDPSHTTDAHEGEEVVWSDTMPGAVQAWPADV